MKGIGTNNTRAPRELSPANETQAAEKPSTASDGLLATFREQSALLHSLEARGALGPEGSRLMPSIDDAIAFLESVAVREVIS